MKIQLIFALLPILALSVIKAANAASFKSADDIIQAANLAAYYAGQDGRAEARMIITDHQGRIQRRQFTMLRLNREPGGIQDVMVFFSYPSDVRDTVFRVVRHPGDNDDRWLYLPGLDLVKRISAGDQRTSFAGSDFFYEDVSGRDPAADKHKLLETSDEYYVIESTPIEAGKVEFIRYKSWIDKNTLLPVKVEYFNSRDEVYRRMENLKVENIEGHPTAVAGRITDLSRGSKTELQMRGVRYDIGLSASIFSERSLRNPPKQWLRAK